MSRYIATRALSGANLIVQEFDAQLQKALEDVRVERPDDKLFQIIIPGREEEIFLARPAYGSQVCRRNVTIRVAAHGK